jgi:DNA primase
VAATERSLALLLEAGFEAKVLALPGGLDPDSFIRQKGVAAYRERLAAAPAYLDYLTERAISTHDVTTPEGKVGAANAVLPYLAKVPNPMLRAELANRLAERLHVDERLLRDELQRAAGAGEREVRARPGLAASKATAAEKELLQALLQDERLADQLLPEIVGEGMAEGSPSEAIFKRFLELRTGAEKEVEVAKLEESLTAEAREVLYESLFWPVRRPEQSAEGLNGHLRAMRAVAARRRLETLKRSLVEAVQSQDWSKVRELEQSKSKLENDLRGIEAGKKIFIK